MNRLTDAPAADRMVAVQMDERAAILSGYGVVAIEAATLEESRRVLARSVARDIEWAPRLSCGRGMDRSTPEEKASEYARLLVEEFQGGIAVEHFAKALVSALMDRDEEESEAFASWLRYESGRVLCNSSVVA